MNERKDIFEDLQEADDLSVKECRTQWWSAEVFQWNKSPCIRINFNILKVAFVDLWKASQQRCLRWCHQVMTGDWITEVSAGRRWPSWPSEKMRWMNVSCNLSHWSSTKIWVPQTWHLTHAKESDVEIQDFSSEKYFSHVSANPNECVRMSNLGVCVCAAQPARCKMAAQQPAR